MILVWICEVAMWAWIVGGLFLLVPWVAVWWTIRHPAVRGDEPARHAVPSPKLDDADAWLVENYGLNEVQRANVRGAVGMGWVVDPDELRPVVVAYVRWLRERPPPGWRTIIRRHLASSFVCGVVGVGLAWLVDVGLPVDVGGLRGLLAIGIIFGVAVGIVGAVVDIFFGSDPTGRLERAERLNAEAPAGPGPQHWSRTPSVPWIA